MREEWLHKRSAPAWPQRARADRLPMRDRRRPPLLSVSRSLEGIVVYEESESSHPDAWHPYEYDDSLFCSDGFEGEDFYDLETYWEWCGYVGIFGGWIC